MILLEQVEYRHPGPFPIANAGCTPGQPLALCDGSRQHGDTAAQRSAGSVASGEGKGCLPPGQIRGRVAPVAALVLLAHIGDHGVRVLLLDLQRGGQGIFGRDRHMLRGSIQIHSDGVVPHPLSPSSQPPPPLVPIRSEEHTSELQSLMRISYAVFCLKKKKNKPHTYQHSTLISPLTSTIP